MNGRHGASLYKSGAPISRRRFLRGLGTAVAGLLAAGCRPIRPWMSTSMRVKEQEPAPVDSLQSTARATPPSPLSPPIGVARGIYPGRVVWVHNPDAVRWDGSTGAWWQEGNIDQAVVSNMLSQALREQTGQSDDVAAWDALFRYFNETHGRPGIGYQAGEKIAIKLNLNACDSHTYRDNGSFTAPQWVYALLQGLVTAAGVPGTDVTVYDATRHIPDPIYERCHVPALAGVHFVDWSGGQGREAYRRDLSCQVHWSENVHGNPTYLPTCVTQARYMINLASLKGHNLAGVTLCAKNHLGTICSDLDGKPTQQAPQGANIHGTFAAHDFGWGDPDWTWSQRPIGTYNALVDLMGHQHLGNKTLLFVLDALYVAQNQGSSISNDCRWQSAPFNGHWPASILVSQDGVAIDSVGLDFLSAEPTIRSLPDVLPPNSTCENYLHEAALADDPPSGTFYDPEGNGSGLASLGVHEHWNNATDKQYSADEYIRRNLGTGEGIELVSC